MKYLECAEVSSAKARRYRSNEHFHIRCCQCRISCPRRIKRSHRVDNSYVRVDGRSCRCRPQSVAITLPSRHRAPPLAPRGFASPRHRRHSPNFRRGRLKMAMIQISRQSRLLLGPAPNALMALTLPTQRRTSPQGEAFQIARQRGGHCLAVRAALAHRRHPETERLRASGIGSGGSHGRKGVFVRGVKEMRCLGNHTGMGTRGFILVEIIKYLVRLQARTALGRMTCQYKSGQFHAVEHRTPSKNIRN